MITFFNFIHKLKNPEKEQLRSNFAGPLRIPIGIQPGKLTVFTHAALLKLVIPEKKFNDVQSLAEKIDQIQKSVTINF